MVHFRVTLKLRANGRNNSQHCWPNNVGSCCVRVGSGLETDATSPNIVGPTVLGVVASVLAVACKRMQQLLTALAHHGCWSITQSYGVTVSNETMCDARGWPQHCSKSCANGSNIVALHSGDHGTKEMLGVVGSKHWPVSTFAHNSKQHATRCANGRNI